MNAVAGAARVARDEEAIIAKARWDLARFYEDGVQLVRLCTGRSLPLRETAPLLRRPFRGMARLDTTEPHVLGPSVVTALLPYWLSAGRVRSLLEWVADAVQLFADLVDAREVGARLLVGDAPHCPRFHVDHVPARAVIALVGPGTEWLPSALVNRAGLGAGSALPPVLRDPELGDAGAVHHVATGELAVFKGETWPGNEGRSVVHRSPAAPGGRRAVLTLDWLE
jgi:hypothetical protein